MIEFDIVIATRNSANTLRGCLESVRKLFYRVSPNVIVIDGASTDETLSIVESFNDIISTVVSESDSGVYDAWNKGIRQCVHSHVLFLGSDDYLCGSEFLEYLSFASSHRDADFISCRVRLVDKDGHQIREVGRPWTWPKFQRYMCAAHPGSLTSVDYIRDSGGFDESLKICGDYELLMRAGPNLRTAHWDRPAVCMRTGGLSDGTKALRETLRVKLKAGYRNRLLCYSDYAVGTVKYALRSYLLDSR